MHPDLEFFLEDAFKSVRQTSSEVGRVVVEPDYDVAPEPNDAGPLANELVQCLCKTSINKDALSSHGGFDITVPSAYRVLGKYIRRITLHADGVEGEWIEVDPPGNWI
jgi:hypothetical protein